MPLAFLLLQSSEFFDNVLFDGKYLKLFRKLPKFNFRMSTAFADCIFKNRLGRELRKANFKSHRLLNGMQNARHGGRVYRTHRTTWNVLWKKIPFCCVPTESVLNKSIKHGSQSNVNTLRWCLHIVSLQILYKNRLAWFRFSTKSFIALIACVRVVNFNISRFVQKRKMSRKCKGKYLLVN